MSFWNKFLGHKNQAPERETPAAELRENENLQKNFAETGLAGAEKTEAIPNLDRRTEILRNSNEELEKAGWDINKEKDFQIFVENAKNILGIPAEEFMKNYIDNEKIITDENLKKIADTLNEMAEIKEFNRLAGTGGLGEGKKTSLQRIRELTKHQATKIAIFGLILFLKFAPPANAAEGKKDIPGGPKAKTEKSTIQTQKTDGGPDKNYKLTPGELENSKMENLAKINLTSTYETNKADISPADAANIQQAFDNFLNEINAKNFAKIAALDFKIFGSSDERPTVAFEAGGKIIKGDNEDLTKARMTSAVKILQDALKNHDFSHSGLTADQIKILQSKTFKAEIPQSQTGPEKGVTYITDLKNPGTGENYTPAEVEKMKTDNPNLYKQLLDQNRNITFNAMAYSEAEQKLTTTLSEYDRVMILVDNSPSMTDKRAAFADKISQISENAKIAKTYFGTYSGNLDSLTAAKDVKDVAKKVSQEKTKGSSQEKTITAAIAGLKQFPDKENKPGEVIRDALILCTDEAIQDLTLSSLQELQRLATEKGVDIIFTFGLDRTTNLDGLAKEFYKIHDQKVSVIEAGIATIQKAGEKHALNKAQKTELAALEKQKEKLDTNPILMTKVRFIAAASSVNVNLPIYN